MRVKIEETREVSEVETPAGKVRERRDGTLVLENPDFEIHIKKEKDGSYTVDLDIKHVRIGHDHSDMIYVRITGIPAETHEPCVYTGRGSYRVVRTVKVKVMGDPAEIEKVEEGDWKKFYDRTG